MLEKSIIFVSFQKTVQNKRVALKIYDTESELVYESVRDLNDEAAKNVAINMTWSIVQMNIVEISAAPYEVNETRFIVSGLEVGPMLGGSGRLYSPNKRYHLSAQSNPRW